MKQADGLDLMIQERSRDKIVYSNGLNEKESRIRRGGHARAGVWVIRDSGENKQRLGERKEVVHVERGQPCLCRSLERSAQACGQGQNGSQHVPMGESRGK